MNQFSAEEFSLVVDDRADVHVSSKNGRFYLGWFPLGRPGQQYPDDQVGGVEADRAYQRRSVNRSG
ncbi:hypothetical protein ABZ260_13870 [Streptosporangium sp. NPDC006013]|uniref:hypothetical protein n=1 Tax=Streptosporangium sp. NPDC006013 TaxID=3155596 RepID=UPI0033AAC521